MHLQLLVHWSSTIKSTIASYPFLVYGMNLYNIMTNFRIQRDSTEAAELT